MTDSEANQSTNYSKISNDPNALLKLVNEYVKVQVIKNCTYVGFVHSIDPVTHRFFDIEVIYYSLILLHYSIILSIPQEEAYQTVIIPGHAVFDISNEELPANILPPLKKQCHIDSKDDIMKKKNKLISWFKTNLLPVTELDDKIVIGNVTLLSPYNITDLCTDNPIVAMQIKNVIEKMPKDYEPK